MSNGFLILIVVSFLLQISFAQSDMIYIQGVITKASSCATPALTLLKGSGYIKFGFCMDEPSKYTFMVEAKTNQQGVVTIVRDTIDNTNPNTIRVAVVPSKFKIIAGKEYSVNTSYFDPWIQKAEKDGELDIELAEPSNCTVVIEDAQGGNQVNNPSFEESTSGILMPGWNIVNSPAGEVSLNKTIKHSGKASLCLTKKDAEGSVSFSQSEPIKVEASKSYLAAGYFHLENARYGSVFNFIVTISSPDKKDIHVEPLYTSDRVIYPMPISNPKSGWNRTFWNLYFKRGK